MNMSLVDRIRHASWLFGLKVAREVMKHHPGLAENPSRFFDTFVEKIENEVKYDEGMSPYVDEIYADEDLSEAFREGAVEAMSAIVGGHDIPDEKRLSPLYVWTLPQTDINRDLGGMELGDVVGLPERAEDVVTRKEMLNYTINKMVRVANVLDERGFTNEANRVDEVLNKIAQDEDVLRKQIDDFYAQMQTIVTDAIQQVDYEYQTFPFKDKVWAIVEQKADEAGFDSYEVEQWLKSNLNNMLLKSVQDSKSK